MIDAKDSEYKMMEGVGHTLSEPSQRNKDLLSKKSNNKKGGGGSKESLRKVPNWLKSK